MCLSISLRGLAITGIGDTGTTFQLKNLGDTNGNHRCFVSLCVLIAGSGDDFVGEPT